MLHELGHFGHPAILHKAQVLRVGIVAVIGGLIREIHRDGKTIGVLAAGFPRNGKVTYTGNCREPGEGGQKCSLLGRPCVMTQPEEGCMPDHFIAMLAADSGNSSAKQR